MKRERERIDNRGFSLVEIIISITILAVVTLPVLHTLVMSARYNAKARERQRVTTSAESIMESFKAYELQEIYTQFQNKSFRGCTVDTSSTLAVTGVDALGNDKSVTIEEDGRLTELAENEAYLYSIAKLQNESKHYDARVTVKAVADKISVNVVELKDFNPYRDAIMKGIGETSNFSEIMKADFKAHYAIDFVDELNDKDESIVVFTEDDLDYNYLSPEKRNISISLYESGENAVVSYEITCKYKMKDYPYQVMESGVLTTKEDLESGEYEVQIQGSTQAYSNPKDKLDRVFFYYYPLYDVEKDIIYIDNQLADTVDIYVVKQVRGIDMTTLQTKEASYVGTVSYGGSGTAKLYHNLDENISGSSSTPTPQIAGITNVSAMKDSDFMQTQQTLMYEVTVEIFEEGQAALGFTGTPIARLEGTTNE